MDAAAAVTAPFTCPRCGAVSHNPHDAEERYCARCHLFVADPSALPGYWMHETSGALRPVIEDYLHHRPMTDAQIAIMRAYLRQWIAGPAWRNVEDLQQDIGGLTSRAEIEEWLNRALDAGIDPL
jgi:hypothetical protein